MIDDLISREEAYKAFSDYLNRNIIGEISSRTELSIGEIANVIKSIPTAFDKEKVIGELNEKADYARNRWLNSIKEGQTKYWEGKENGIREAIEVIEKGGIG